MRRSRRAFLVLAALALAACYVTRVSDEDRVVDYASRQMSCDPSLIRLESESASDDHVARYSAHGCGQTRIFDCTQEGENVVCRPMRRTPTTESDGNSTAGSVLAGVLIGSACACARAGSGAGSRAPSAPTRAPNTTPSDPVRSN